MKNNFIISIDMGGTKILSALINSQNKIIDRVKLPTDVEKGQDKIIESLINSIEQLLTQNNIGRKSIKAICFGVPGTVDPISGIISNAPNLNMKNFNIKEILSNHFSIPILVENDVNLAGLGIKKFEFDDNVKNMLVVFIGTGIGSALFFNGHIYRGSTFYAGEIGHILVNKKGAIAIKNSNVTLESKASRVAIVNSIKKDIKKGKKSLLSDLISSGQSIKSKTLAKAVYDNDTLAVKHVSKACEIIGTVIGSLTTFLNFDTIVLGGGVIEAMYEFMLPKIKESFYGAVIPECGKSVKIEVSKLGDDAPLYGGITLAEEFNLSLK